MELEPELGLTCICHFNPRVESYDFALTSINFMDVPVLTTISVVACGVCACGCMFIYVCM